MRQTGSSPRATPPAAVVPSRDAVGRRKPGGTLGYVVGAALVYWGLNLAGLTAPWANFLDRGSWIVGLGILALVVQWTLNPRPVPRPFAEGPVDPLRLQNLRPVADPR